MAGIKESGSFESFQKWLPLKIVPTDEIPNPSQLQSFNSANLNDYLKLAVALQIFCTTKNGIGLAAVQCGIPSSLIVVSEDTVNYRNFIDCSYEGIGEQSDSLEGCLSIVGEKGRLRRFLLKRYKKIRVKGFEIILNNPKKQYEEIDETFDGLFGVVLQHEIDHNRGTLISDIGKEVEVIN